MYADSAKVIKEDEDGNRIVKAVLIADTTPAILPTTGEGIKGLTAKDTFAPFSMMYVTADVENKVYITNESGVFIPQ